MSKLPRAAHRGFLNLEKAEMLMRGLAHIGIIALVDEAIGYQEVRDRLALQAILDPVLPLRGFPPM
jgi:hypothetical protein